MILKNWTLFQPVFEYEELYPDYTEPWSGHKYFAYDIVANIKPKIIVELGTHKGTSFFSFCQAVKDFKLPTILNAVDTWKGDPHTGLYGEEVYESVNLIINRFYPNVSIVLHRETFDEVVRRFADFSIDILHIDGYHTYDVVKHDFETWFPKISKNGVVLFHDTNEMRDDFGVYKFWEELVERFKQNLSFFHSHGLGVIFLGNTEEYQNFLQGTDFNISNYYDLYSEKERYLGLFKLNKSQNKQYESQLSLLHLDLETLKIQIQEKENLIHRDEKIIHSLYNSYSWKITEPLRWLHPWIFKFFYFFFPSNYIMEIKRFFVKMMGKFPTLITEAFNVDKINEIRYVPFVENKPFKDAPVKILAFYLPQFHAIPENDAWWGEGFTEWTNVERAQPQFKGHYQPHIPRELGYYNLLDLNVQQQQVELAKNYGIGGFCFHFYWFNGKRLLEKPIENYLLNNQLDLPFCLSWANENWTRRWDGMENEILIRQQHSPEDDVAFIRYVSKYMQDKRYIHINNKPLLMVYRPGLLPSAKETAGRWRNWCKVHGIGEIYLAYIQSFEKINPEEYGYDAAVEFPPNIFCPPIVTHLVKPFNRNFNCNMYDWKSMVKSSEHYSVPDYKLFRGVCPSWDNTPRRKNESAIFINNHPDDFKEWVYNASVDTCKRFENPDERLVFVNAWNEWAEGAYLEPDEKYGYAWLEAVQQGILMTKKEMKSHKIILVSHDAHPHGAQINALEMTRTLIRDLKINVEVILLGDGILKDSFEALTRVHDLSNININDTKVIELVRSLARRGYKKAIVNTTVSGKLIPVLFREGIDCISLVHELPGIIKSYNLENSIKDIASFAKKIVFGAQIVEDGFKKFSHVDSDKLIIQPQGLYYRNKWRFEKESARKILREELGIEPEIKVVLSVAYADHRKGVDLFVDMGLQILLKRTDVVFIWVGNIEHSMQNVIKSKLDHNPLKKYFYFVGFKSNPGIYYAASDAFALTAREDAFPSVVMESFDVGLPVVAFEGSGGAATLVDQVGGVVVPANDVKKFAEEVNSLIDDHILNSELGMHGQEYVDKNFSYRKYMFFLCELLDIKLPRLSVIVPNYNYENYIIERLNSIMNQSMPIYELIILDDASTDNSKQNILKWLQETNVEIKLIINESNSGAVIHQWEKGLEYTTGDFVWIAEADDLSEPDFLETVLPSLMIDGVVLSYCESKRIDSAGKIVANDYHDYLKDVSAERWSHDYTGEGIEEIKSSLAVLNTIPNVSAVLFRRDVLTTVFNDYFEEFMRFKKAGDYIVYVRLLSAGKLSFSTNNANIHRRHKNSVIAESDAMELYREIAEIQKIVANDFDINESTQKLAKRYLSILRKQFNLMDP